MKVHDYGNLCKSFKQNSLKHIQLHLGQKKKNSCVSGSPTDPKISGPALDFFSKKKKKKKKFKFHSVTTHTHKLW